LKSFDGDDDIFGLGIQPVQVNHKLHVSRGVLRGNRGISQIIFFLVVAF